MKYGSRAVGYKNKHDVEGKRRNSEGLLEGATVFKYTWPVGSKPPIKRYFLRPLLRYGVVSFTSKGNFDVTLPLSEYNKLSEKVPGLAGLTE